MSYIVELGRSNLEVMEEILMDVGAVIFGLGLPILGATFMALFLFAIACVVGEKVVDFMIERKRRYLEKVAILEKCDITSSED